MGPVFNLKGKTEITMEASTSKNHLKVEQKLEEEDMRCASNQECKIDVGNAFDECKPELCKSDDAELDVINGANDCEGGLLQTQSGDVTGSSSSFGDTFPEARDREYESDGEVVSELHGNAPPMAGVGGPGDLFPVRKRRVTSHWRTFIQPLMWRCKWVELQIKKFQSQAVKYDKELEKNNQTKQTLFKHGNIGLEGLCARSMPFSHHSQREKAKKRRIRERHEDFDIDAYMSRHNLFSYFATRRSITGGATFDDDQNNLVIYTDKNIKDEFPVSDGLSSFEIRDDHLLEQILWKIEVAHSHVCEMKTRLNTVMSGNAERFLSVDELSLHIPNNDVTESASPARRNGPSLGAAFASQLMGYNTGDLVKPESQDSSHEDVIEHADQPPVVASRKSSTDGILIYNRRAKKPRTDSVDIKIHPIESLQAPKEERKEENPVSVSEDSNKKENAPKLRSLSKLTGPSNKRKRAARARRKASSSLWSRRSSG